MIIIIIKLLETAHSQSLEEKLANIHKLSSNFLATIDNTRGYFCYQKYTSFELW